MVVFLKGEIPNAENALQEAKEPFLLVDRRPSSLDFSVPKESFLSVAVFFCFTASACSCHPGGPGMFPHGNQSSSSSIFPHILNLSVNFGSQHRLEVIILDTQHELFLGLPSPLANRAVLIYFSFFRWSFPLMWLLSVSSQGT